MVYRYKKSKVEIKKISVDKINSGLPDINLRYKLVIPLKDREEGINVTVILMNPSKADDCVSDNSVNKIIEFFYDYTEGINKVKQITILNVMPVYGSSPKQVAIKLKELYSNDLLQDIQTQNLKKFKSVLIKSSKVVLAWGKPSVNTIHNLYYYSQIYEVLNLLKKVEKKIFVFDVRDANKTFTENGDPRHVRGSVILNDLIKTDIVELLGLQ